MNLNDEKTLKASRLRHAVSKAIRAQCSRWDAEREIETLLGVDELETEEMLKDAAMEADPDGVLPDHVLTDLVEAFTETAKNELTAGDPDPRVAMAMKHNDFIELPCVLPGTPARVYFEWGLANADGAWFVLLREPHHSDNDMSQAKRLIRNNRDVVRLTVECVE